MTAPKRIQMSRQRPWRHEHPDAVIVARPGRWGNPYRVADEGRAEAVALFRGMILGDWGGEHDYPLIHELAGRDLACWCPLDQPCHADVLLELANTAPVHDHDPVHEGCRRCEALPLNGVPCEPPAQTVPHQEGPDHG